VKRIVIGVGVLEKGVSAQMPDGFLTQVPSDSFDPRVPEEDFPTTIHGVEPDRHGFENQTKEIGVDRSRHGRRGNPRGAGSTLQAAERKTKVR
jgi:hypothetical protein